MASTAGVRLLLKFNFAQQIRNAGWSEYLDTTFADLPTAIGNTANFDAYIQDRVNCLGAGPVLISAVLIAYIQPPTPGAVPIRRGSVAIPVPPFPPAGQAYNKAFNPSTPFTADFAPTVYYISLQTDLLGTPVYRRSFWVAGLPDIADQTNTNQIIDPATLTAVKKLLNDLSNTGPALAAKCRFALRSVDRSGGNPIKQCTAINLPANTYTVPTHGFVVGQPVVAVGFKSRPGGIAPRGDYLIGNVVDANTITLRNALAPSANTEPGGFRARVYAWNAFGVATGQGFTKRDKGRPFELSVGRRRAPAISRA
jgi:hypothetical protein